MNPRKREIAAENGLCLLAKPVGQRIRKRGNTRNRRNAQRNTRDEDAKAGEAALQIAQGKAPQHGPW